MRRVRRRGRSFVPISPEKERRTRGGEAIAVSMALFSKWRAVSVIAEVRTHTDFSVTRGSGARSDLRRPLGQI